MSTFSSQLIVTPVNSSAISSWASASSFLSNVTLTTPSIASTADLTFSLSPFATIWRLLPRTICLVRFSGVSLAIIFPLLIMIISSQTALISCIIWELKNTVCSFAKSFISSRISIIWLGSRPTVGSSSISISGLPAIAPARPTLCLYPLDRCLISLSDTSRIFVLSIILCISFSLFCLGTFFSSETNCRYSLTRKSG